MHKRTMYAQDFPLYKQAGWTPPAQGAFPFLAFSLVLSNVVYLLETYLDLRQRKRLQATEPPPLLLSTLEQVDGGAAADAATSLRAKAVAKFNTSQEYGRAKSAFGLFSATARHLIEMALLLAGAHPYLWDAATRVVVRCGGDAAHTTKVSLVFAGLSVLLGELESLPFSLYFTFVVEARHNFNKTTPALFLADKLKSLALTAAIGAPVLSALIWIMDRGGDLLFLYLWACLFLVALAGLTIYPTLIAPLFNAYAPLPDGELRAAIEALARRVRFPLTELYVVDGSRRSAHSNAYMYGFGRNKRIVMFDTLLKQVEQPELVAILGHELGHWEMGHTLRNFAVTQVYLLAMLFGYGVATVAVGADLFASFGFASDQRPALLSLILYLTALMTPADHVIHLAMNYWSRHCEFQADEYAVKLGYAQALQTGLCKLSLENLGNMNPDPLYSAYHYSHPPLVERLSAIMQAEGRGIKKVD
eukprot:TRINITY_DN2941_c0_g1_i1.p2 TRINITY_DN2941_c0_g1~~TRINITY_DN2941_c0_g1_i1.p2  ORF type:complete len:475 (-),score=204.35 TRINITY_DN2941_c0_g1_i1:498-1922(-)